MECSWRLGGRSIKKGDNVGKYVCVTLPFRPRCRIQDVTFRSHITGEPEWISPDRSRSFDSLRLYLKTTMRPTFTGPTNENHHSPQACRDIPVTVIVQVRSSQAALRKFRRCVSEKESTKRTEILSKAIYG